MVDKPIDLFIIAAGKGSRMGGSIPKALVPLVDGIPNLTTTLQQIGHKFHNVYVVTNEEVFSAWEDYFIELKLKYPELSNNVRNISISSGRGDGHAVMEGMREARSMCDEIVVAWGDVFFPEEELIDELLSKQIIMGVVPTVFRADPYVALRLHENKILYANFSKHGEDTRDGYHDQSVFRFDRRSLRGALEIMHDVLNKNGKYITANGEMSLLHVFHYVANTSSEEIPEIQAYETKYPTLSFNTVEEVAQIQKEINQKWKHKFRNQS
jgi:NDP-sugar pyrophosphorylase family protein